MRRVLSLALSLAIGACLSVPARADDGADLMARFSGAWVGGGQLLFGADNGLRFRCELNGKPSRAQLSFGMTGRCSMAGISAPVHAKLRYNVETDRFYGAFMDGGDGEGVNVVGAPVKNGVALQLSQGPAKGRIMAEAVNADQMKVTMYVLDRAHNREVAVMAMGFTRKEAGAAGLADYLPEIPTASIK
jgi:hypothetical protein